MGCKTYLFRYRAVDLGHVTKDGACVFCAHSSRARWRRGLGSRLRPVMASLIMPRGIVFSLAVSWRRSI